MTIIEIFLLLTIAAVIHASFQLSVSLMTVMSGHALGQKVAHKRLVGLLGSFITGTVLMTILILSFIRLLVGLYWSDEVPMVAWVAICGLVLGTGVAVWIFYYRPKAKGTSLWIPRSFANYLSDRAKSTKSSAESFGLGVSSLVSELVFCISPLVVVAFLLSSLSTAYQLPGILLYALVANLPQVIILGLVGSGQSISKIQKWRETNKRFLQFTAGSLLIILSLYLYVTIVLGQAIQGVVA